MHWFYAAVIGLVLASVIAAVYTQPRELWRRQSALVMAWAVIIGAWTVLGVIGVASGWWAYNNVYVLGLRLLGLPLEEVGKYLLLLLVGVATLRKVCRINQNTVDELAVRRIMLMAVGALIFYFLVSFYREFAALACLLALGVIVLLLRSSLIGRQAFWYWNGAIIIGCLAVDTLLTTASVVQYNDTYLSGLRLLNVPVESLLYYFSLINLTALAYSAQQKLQLYWRFLVKWSATRPLTIPRSAQLKMYLTRPDISNTDTL